MADQDRMSMSARAHQLEQQEATPAAVIQDQLRQVIIDHEFIAVGPLCWGRGKTRQEAIRNMRANWSPSVSGQKRPSVAACLDHLDVHIHAVPLPSDPDVLGCWVSGLDGAIHWDTAHLDHDPQPCQLCTVASFRG